MKKKIVFIILCVFYISAGLSVNAQTLGDVNSSGGIDILDALLIAQHYVGLYPQNFNSAYRKPAASDGRPASNIGR